MDDTGSDQQYRRWRDEQYERRIAALEAEVAEFRKLLGLKEKEQPLANAVRNYAHLHPDFKGYTGQQGYGGGRPYEVLFGKNKS